MECGEGKIGEEGKPTQGCVLEVVTSGHQVVTRESMGRCIPTPQWSRIAVNPLPFLVLWEVHQCRALWQALNTV